MPKPKRTTKMVTTWPTAAIQRSWISCCMFCSPVASVNKAARARLPTAASSGLCDILEFTCSDPGTADGHDGKRIPSDRISEMTVAKCSDRQAANRSDRLSWQARGIDEVRRDAPQPAPPGNRPNIAGEPAIGGRVIPAQKCPLRLGHPQQAGHDRRLVGREHPMHAGLAPLRRDETPIHENCGSVLQLQRRQDPVSGSQRGNRLNVGLPVIREYPRRAHVPVFITGGVYAAPLTHRRSCHRCCVNTTRNSRDQLKLPGTALDLPGAERKKNGKQPDRPNDQRLPQRSPGNHGMLRMSDIDAGIMLSFRWYITHNEPLKAMTTSMSVNNRASRDQPPSVRAFMCRKYTMCTTICTAAKPRTTAAVTPGRVSTCPMTSQKGIAVRPTDNRKPVI